DAMESWQFGSLVALALALAALMMWWTYFWCCRLTSHGKQRRKCGYSVWRYQGEVWVMTEDHSKPGYVPGEAPIGRGQFEGDINLVGAVPRREGPADGGGRPRPVPPGRRRRGRGRDRGVRPAGGGARFRRRPPSPCRPRRLRRLLPRERPGGRADKPG